MRLNEQLLQGFFFRFEIFLYLKYLNSSHPVKEEFSMSCGSLFSVGCGWCLGLSGMSVICLQTLQSEQVPLPPELLSAGFSYCTADNIPKRSEYESNQSHTMARHKRIVVNRKTNWFLVYLNVNTKH